MAPPFCCGSAVPLPGQDPDLPQRRPWEIFKLYMGGWLLFDALTVEHEVRESYRKRCAVTLWANGVYLT